MHGSGVSACSSDIQAWSKVLLALGSMDECVGGRGCMHDLNITVVELGKSEKTRDRICEEESKGATYSICFFMSTSKSYIRCEKQL
jgi:hypothetical protein